MTTFFKLAGLSVLLLAIPLNGAAVAEYPEKPVSFVVPFPPGDLEDILTRMIAEDFQNQYGVPAAVVNKPGGGGGPFPGSVGVANARADGYTIGSFVVDVPVVGPMIGIPELNPNPFVPIGSFLTYPFVIAAAKNAPFSDMNSLAEHAKSNDVTLGHFGAELVPTQVTLALAKKLDFSYSYDAPFDALDCNTLASGDVDVINTTLQLILPCLDKVNILANIGSQRLVSTPDAPSVSEIAPDLGIALWNGLFVHKDTPADIQQKIAAVAKTTMASERAKKLAKETGALVYWKNASDTAMQIEKDISTLNLIGKALGE
ncbi:MAG: hypothetical protein JKY49_01535 [Cohaesibacteraceae bacterium]|nr:hypothetical protein [Cohaesibacteraceae bacterium]MBL4875219.1 hypothetical protein [Cohaesibacteraceae bacterium]